jgi:NAD(P)-dependent dehydrogenase (short-subunit alcohol dehydrogenase family)
MVTVPDRSAIVTGAAGGVGRELIRMLVEAGYGVIAEDLSPSVSELDDPGRVVSLQADVSLSASARQAVELAESHFGRLDLLVNNAGRFLRAPIAESTDEQWDALMAVNARGPFVHSREAMPLLIASGGCIVNVGSISGLVGLNNQSVYSSSKGALIQFTRELAVEMGPAGVRVNAVAAGAIDTEFASAYQKNEDAETAERSLRERYPLARISSAAEVAQVVVFLASPASSAMTGTILPIDGGYTAR